MPERTVCFYEKVRLLEILNQTKVKREYKQMMDSVMKMQHFIPHNHAIDSDSSMLNPLCKCRPYGNWSIVMRKAARMG